MEEENKKLRMAVIAGAAQAIKYKSKFPKSSDEEAIQDITSRVAEIIDEIDDEL
tara:strand:+ start:1227 stop:1388 length:162 start_codon:yes stop_codon:yes gene_type:complete